MKLVKETHHKYLRQLTKAKSQSDDFYTLQEKLNQLRNKNDRYWYWYKKEKEIYTKSIKSFSRLTDFSRK